MSKRPIPPDVTEKEMQALLERYACPVPFHEVRTRFLGRIASPTLSTSPIKDMESLWGGELPEFESLDAANEAIGALVMGLWNRLTRHQERRTPFHLLRVGTTASRDGLATLALIRRQEIDGFIEGLFGDKEAIDLPERAHRGLSALGEMRALIDGVHQVMSDPTRSMAEKDIKGIGQQISELTKIGEHEIHAVVMSCARARRQMLAALPISKPTLH